MVYLLAGCPVMLVKKLSAKHSSMVMALQPAEGGFRGGLFDADGTLIKSERTYFDTVNMLLAPHGIRIGEEEYVDRYMIRHTGSAGIIRDYGLDVSPEEFREAKSRILRELIGEGLKAMPHAPAVVARLAAEYPLGVVTTENRHEFDMKRRGLGFFDSFRFFVTADDVRHKKPHPEPYRLGVEMLSGQVPGIRACEVFAVEDSPSGAASARGAGCAVIAYPNGFTADLEFPYADATVGSLEEITPAFLRGLYAATRTD